MNNASASVHPLPQANFDIEAQRPETGVETTTNSSEQMRKMAHIIGTTLFCAAGACSMYAIAAVLANTSQTGFIAATTVGTFIGGVLGATTGYNETRPGTSRDQG